MSLAGQASKFENASGTEPLDKTPWAQSSSHQHSIGRHRVDILVFSSTCSSMQYTIMLIMRQPASSHRQQPASQTHLGMQHPSAARHTCNSIGMQHPAIFSDTLAVANQQLAAASNTSCSQQHILQPATHLAAGSHQAASSHQQPSQQPAAFSSHQQPSV